MRRDKLGLERIVFFSDAVFAIAITLLALELKLPTISEKGHISSALLELWPKYQSYTTSFLIIGLYWMGHHHYFRFIRRYNYVFIGLNTGLLASIALLPFATSVLDAYPTRPGAIAFYAACMAITGYLKTVLWCYAVHGGNLVPSSLSHQRQKQLFYRALIPPVVFTLSIVLAPLNPTFAKLSWTAIGLICIPMPPIARLHKNR